MSTDTFRIASKSDVEAVAQLVNKAYRPGADSTGWTHESALVLGKRTNDEQVLAAIAEPNSVVLVSLQDSGIVACIQVEKDGANSHIGMFAVDPALQTTGIGKQMLAHAEQYAGEVYGAEKFTMTVVSARSELIAFYLRRGYQKTGVTQDYPSLAGLGTPKFPSLKTEVLVKINPSVKRCADARILLPRAA